MLFNSLERNCEIKEDKMDIDNMSTEDLEEKIKGRKGQILRYLKFAEDIVRKRGKLLNEIVESNYIHRINCLLNFAEFSFLVSGGETLAGGNSIKAWYHPGIAQIDMEKDDYLVLSLYYKIEAVNFEVRVFKDDDAWQSALDYVIKHKKETIKETERKKKQEREQQTKDANKVSKRNQLLKEAKKLKL